MASPASEAADDLLPGSLKPTGSLQPGLGIDMMTHNLGITETCNLALEADAGMFSNGINGINMSIDTDTLREMASGLGLTMARRQANPVRFTSHEQIPVVLTPTISNAQQPCREQGRKALKKSLDNLEPTWSDESEIGGKSLDHQWRHHVGYGDSKPLN